MERPGDEVAAQLSWLLDQDPDPGLKNEVGESTLHGAIWRRDVCVARLLVEQDAIAITRKLGVLYLCVDAVSIV